MTGPDGVAASRVARPRRPGVVVLVPVLLLTMLAFTAGPVAAQPVPAAPDGPCAEVRAERFEPARGVAEPDGVVRVVAVQMKQEVRHVTTYDAFTTKVRCLFDDLARPHLSEDTPTLVVYPEYAGLATLAVGSRGAPARAIAEGPTRGVGAEAGVPGGALQALGTLGVTYAGPLAHYATVQAARQAAEDPEAAADPERSFALADPRRALASAVTDTLARAFLPVHSGLAREEGVFVVSSTLLPELRRSTDPVEVAALADPDLDDVDHVWVAADGRLFNEVWVWSPDPGQTAFSRERFGELPADDPRANVVHVNRKAPITPLEEEFLALTPGDTSPANTGPFTLDGVAGLTFGVANSLPAFAWGTGPTETGEDLGEPFPADRDPCGDASSWMRCLDARGTDVVLQTEANPAPWAAYSDPNGNWQPLLWGNSSWRHVADPQVSFAYTVTPWLVGNLVDLPFDGQANVKRRDNPRPWPVPHFVGNRTFLDGVDPGFGAPFAGPKDEFVVLAPWVLDDDPSLPLAEDRDRLAARAAAMSAGAGPPHENSHLETAVWADLVPPPATPAADGPAEAATGAPGAAASERTAMPPTDASRPERPLPVTGGAPLGLLGAALLAGVLGRRRDVPRGGVRARAR